MERLYHKGDIGGAERPGIAGTRCASPADRLSRRPPKQSRVISTHSRIGTIVSFFIYHKSEKNQGMRTISHPSLSELLPI